MCAYQQDPELGNALEAYILAQTEPGKADRLVLKARMVPGITSADAVTGPYDVIARARVATLEDLQRRIVPRMQAMDGIIRVLVSPIVHGSVQARRLHR